MNLVLNIKERSLLSSKDLLLFMPNNFPIDWDHKEHSSNIPGKPDWRELDQKLPCGAGFIELPFEWDGASSSIFRKLIILNFPKWKHPIATARHDKRCNIAEVFKKSNPALYKKLRKYADKQFPIDVAISGTKWETKKGYCAVRIGAFF